MFENNGHVHVYSPGEGADSSTWNLALIGQAVSEKKMFENNGHVHVYSPGEGADSSLGSKPFQNHKSSVKAKKK